MTNSKRDLFGIAKTTKAVGFGAQSAAKAMTGVSEIGMGAVLALSLLELGNFAVGSAAAGALSGGVMTSTLGAVGLGSLATVGAPVLLGGLVAGAVIVGAVGRKADQSLSKTTGIEASKPAVFPNPISGVAKTVQSVGLAGKGVARLTRGASSLAGTAAIGLLAVEIAGAALGMSSLGAITVGALGAVGVAGVAATGGLAILGGAIVASKLIEGGLKSFEGGIDNAFGLKKNAQPAK